MDKRKDNITEDTTEQDIDKKKRPKTGFTLRLVQAILFMLGVIGLLFGAIFMYLNFQSSSTWADNLSLVFKILLICAAALAAVTTLQFIAAFAGKKRKWGNIFSIVIGAITTPAYFLGLCGLIGGIMGKKYLKSVASEQPQETPKDETVRDSVSDRPTEEYTPAPAPAAEPSPTEYIKPKLPPKAQKAMMIIMIVSYALLLIAGILAATQTISSIFGSMGICEKVSARAYSTVIGLMMLVGVPSIGYYFATIAPVKLPKKAKIILAAITTMLMLALIATAYIVIYFIQVDGLTVNSYFENSDAWFIPMSVAFAPLGLMICYLLTLFRINPEKIRTTKPEQSSNGLAAAIKYIFALIIYGIVRLVKGILSFKEKQPEIFILFATILLTWLAFFTAFVFAIICIAVLLGVVIMYFTGVMRWAYSPERGKTTTEPNLTNEYYMQDEYSYVDSNGYTQTVYTDRNGTEARDAGGHYVGEVSGDGSEKTFTPAASANNSESDE